MLAQRPWVLLVVALVLARFALADHAPYVGDVALCAAAWLLVVVGHSGQGTAAPPRAAALSSTLSFTVAATIAATLVCVGSLEPCSAWLGMSLPLGAIAFFVVGTSAPGATQAALLVGGALHAGAALWQRFVQWPDALARRDALELSVDVVQRLQTGRPIGIAFSPDLGAGLAIIGASAGLAWVARRRDRRDGPDGLQIVAMPAVAVCVVEPLLARSFGTALAVALGVAVVVLARLTSPRAHDDNTPPGRAGTKVSVVVGAAATTIAGVGALALAWSARGGHAASTSVVERIENWRVAWSIFIAHPVVGIGPTRFGAAYLAARAPTSNITRYAHSAPLHVLAESGIIGAVVVVIVLVWNLPRVRDALRSPDTARVCAGFGVVVIALRSLWDYDLQVGQSLMCAAALLGSVVTRMHGDEVTADTRAPAGSWRAPHTIAAAFAWALVVVTLARSAAADGMFGDAAWQRMLDAAPTLERAARSEDPTRRIAVLQPLLVGHGPQPVAALAIARAQLQRGDVDSALDALARALRDDPGNAAAHRLAIALADAGHGDADARRREAARWGVVVDVAP